MPCADPRQRRACDAAGKRGQRTWGWTKKKGGHASNPREIKHAEDLNGLYDEGL